MINSWTPSVYHLFELHNQLNRLHDQLKRINIQLNGHSKVHRTLSWRCLDLTKGRKVCSYSQFWWWLGGRNEIGILFLKLFFVISFTLVFKLILSESNKKYLSTCKPMCTHITGTKQSRGRGDSFYLHIQSCQCKQGRQGQKVFFFRKLLAWGMMGS